MEIWPSYPPRTADASDRASASWRSKPAITSPGALRRGSSSLCRRLTKLLSIVHSLAQLQDLELAALNHAQHRVRLAFVDVVSETETAAAVTLVRLAGPVAALG